MRALLRPAKVLSQSPELTNKLFLRGGIFFPVGQRILWVRAAALTRQALLRPEILRNAEISSGSCFRIHRV